MQGNYKYSCRKCPIRNRCISESDTSPSAKDMIGHAFTNRTDTLSTWAVLQKNCLLIQAEEERDKRAGQESLLSKRLRLAREAKKPELKPLPSKTGQLAKPSQPTPPASTQTSQMADYARPAASTNSPASSARATTPFNDEADRSRPEIIGSTWSISPARKPSAPPSRPCWLTVKGSNHHIRLPVNGELVLGRFDPNLGVPPDVDLAYEDAGTRVVSRRHAKIAAVEGVHTIEDLGSRHGVFLNSEQIGFGPSPPLKPGDVIVLGNLKLNYDLAPLDRLSDSNRHQLMVTATGQKIMIVPPNEIVIGRSDRYVNFTPDIDLKTVGEVAVRVSRRHAIITWRNHAPYIEDLGSGFGTRLNGEVLMLGQAKPLNPGDHIWLGGCVLAYDVEV